MDYMSELKLKIRKYSSDVIYEFDSLDELRVFDNSYVTDTRSKIIKNCAMELMCKEEELVQFEPLKYEDGQVYGCSFQYKDVSYKYDYETTVLERM